MKMETKEIIVKNITAGYQDSLEIGTPAKGGSIKVYCDFKNLEEVKSKIDNAILARSYANEKLEAKNEPKTV